MTRVKQNSIHLEKVIFMALFGVCLLLVSLYMYFLCASVSEVVMRTDTNQQIVTLSSDISELESQYISAQHKVSSEIASLDGYQKTDAKIFIDRSETSLALANANKR